MRGLFDVLLCSFSLKGWTSATGRGDFSWVGTSLLSKVTFIDGFDKKECFPVLDVDAMQADIRR